MPSRQDPIKSAMVAQWLSTESLTG